jgi:hypothetical protein
VDLALKHGCGTIQMEDLKGISKDDVFLKKLDVNANLKIDHLVVSAN